MAILNSNAGPLEGALDLVCAGPGRARVVLVAEAVSLSEATHGRGAATCARL